MSGTQRREETRLGDRPDNVVAFVSEARAAFHEAILSSILRLDENGVPSNADKDSRPSREIARGVYDRLGATRVGARLAGQMAGSQFEMICAAFIKSVFDQLTGHLRPGVWHVRRVGGRNRHEIARYEQYQHLAALDELARANPQLAAALGSDYTITPDVIISREPEPDTTINAPARLVDDEHARLTSLRKVNNPHEILHASISCKWTIRSDRAQNARSEALNLVRNRKGRLPHIVVITAEPLPSRIASIALGTGDIDCVYHFALPELRETLESGDFPDSLEMFLTMVEGKRLRDIADLPFDLVV